VVDSIAVPTLILHDLDDPFIRLLPETRAKLLANPNRILWRLGTEATAPIFPATTGNEIHWARPPSSAFLLQATCRGEWKLTGSLKSAPMSR